MRFQHKGSFRDYVAAGDETTAELLGQPNPFVSALEQADRFFVEDLWKGDIDLDPVPGFLSWNAFAMLLSGFRLALTGHEVAIFPELRTAVEYACYAYQMAKNPDLSSVWLDRHKDAAARKECRNAFNGAVAATASALRAVSQDYGDLVQDGYDAAIDFGGHPNPKAVLQYLRFEDDDASEFQRINSGVLYGSESWHTQRAIVACLDYAVTVGLILLHAPPAPRAAAGASLQSLIETKERLAAEMAA